MKKKTPLKLLPITSRNEAIENLGYIQRDLLEIQEKQIQLDAIISRLQNDLDDVKSDRMDFVKNRIKRLKKWATKHPDEFTEKRSIETPAGTMGFRKNPPSLALIGEPTWEAVIQKFEEDPLMTGYVRVKKEVDKQTLLKDHDALGGLPLLEAGLEIVQEEEFYVKPTLTFVETRLKEGQ